jgi:hypothetical protein
MAKKSFYKCFSSIILKEIGICFPEKKKNRAGPRSTVGPWPFSRPVSRAREVHRAGPLGARPRGTVLPPRGAERVVGVRARDVAAAAMADRPAPVASGRGSERTRTTVK